MAVETMERPIKHISWSAIFVGVVIAMALEGILTFLGHAASLELVNPLNLMAERTLDTGAVLWTLGLPLACLFVGGLLAGLLAGLNNSVDAFLTGAVVWAVVGLFEVGLAALLQLGAPATALARGGPAAYAPYNAALWLMFFSACLSLAGAVAGGLIAVRPRVREPFYREEHRVIPQQ